MLRYVSKWYDSQQVVECQVKGRAFDVERRIMRMAKEADKLNDLQTALEPIR
jgi:hypothetical protein